MNEEIKPYIERLNINGLRECLLNGLKEFAKTIETTNHCSKVCAIALDCDINCGQVEFSYLLENQLQTPNKVTLKDLEPGDWIFHPITDTYAPLFYKEWLEFSRKIETIGAEIYENFDDDELSNQIYYDFIQFTIREVLTKAKGDGVFNSPKISNLCYIFSIDHDEDLKIALENSNYSNFKSE